MKISFDVWGTLIEASPAFKKAKVELIREYAGKSLSSDWIDQVFKEIKHYHDSIIEEFGNQPDDLTLYCELFKKLGIKGNVKIFRLQYLKLFIENPPKVIKGTKQILQKLDSSGHQLLISSNTLFVHGPTLLNALDRIGIRSRFSQWNFSSDRGASKPDYSMFTFRSVPPIGTFRPDYHVGDNPVTDGSCENHGINFYQINSNEKTIIDFYEEIILGNTNK